MEQALSTMTTLDLDWQPHIFMREYQRDSTASTRQQEQEGNYWDSFINLLLLKIREIRISSKQSHVSRYGIDIPIVSDTNTFINEFTYKYYKELYDQNVSTFGITLSSSFSLDDNDVNYLKDYLFQVVN